MSTTKPRFTDEVLAAMRAQGIQRDDRPPPPPQGTVRYHLAVGETVHAGVADAATVATLLEGMAAQLRKDPHG